MTAKVNVDSALFAKDHPTTLPTAQDGVKLVKLPALPIATRENHSALLALPLVEFSKKTLK